VQILKEIKACRERRKKKGCPREGKKELCSPLREKGRHMRRREGGVRKVHCGGGKKKKVEGEKRSKERRGGGLPEVLHPIKGKNTRSRADALLPRKRGGGGPWCTSRRRGKESERRFTRKKSCSLFGKGKKNDERSAQEGGALLP